MRLIYFFLKIIFCSSEFETRQHYCFFVTDRELKGLTLKESSKTIILPLTDDNISFKSYYSWDLYLPKPIFYKIKYINSKKSTSKKSFDLVGITSDEKVMFQFKLTFNVDRVILSDFYDSNNIPITNALFHSDEVSTNIFMLSSEYKNVTSIKSSFTYITLVDKIEPMYYEILNSLFQYIKNINNLSEDFDFFCDISVFERLCKAKNSLISTTITILRNLSSLRLPIFYKLDEIPGNIRFKILLNNLFGSLEDVVEIYLRNKNGDINEEIVVQKKDIHDFIKDKIVQNNLPSRCVQIYEKLTLNLKNIDDHVNEVFYSGKANIEILSDCNLADIDKFMGAYSDLILSYCEIMSNSNDHLVFDAYFLSETSEIDYLIRELKDFYLDKLISGRIMYFIRTFGDDITDFLIFSQTDYFKYMFSSRILKNLKLLSTIKSIHNPEDETQKEMIATFLRIDQEYLCHIAKIEKDWCSILKKDNLDKVKPFNELLKE